MSLRQGLYPDDKEVCIKKYELKLKIEKLVPEYHAITRAV